jgi:ATP-dependent helicase/nuclease subunit A
MTAARAIPESVRRVQIEASDPDISAFVSANAGSGKTHVLAQRVINLLLRGADPAKILCITFTKAAAANMATRVFETLAEWTALDESALDGRIRLSTGRDPSPAERARARRLFASALETPGGLKVQTIHAFCTRLLHQFPFEANVAARFTVLDDAATAQLLERLTLDVLLQASNDADSALGRALAEAIVFAADKTLKEVIADAIRQRDTLTAWIARAGGIDKALANLSRSLDLAPGDSRDKVETEFLSASHIPETEWPALTDALAQGSKTDYSHIDALEAARKADGRERIDEYLKIFCTTAGEMRKNVVTKKIIEQFPQWHARLVKEQDRLRALLARERALATRDRTAALITIAKAVIDRYAAEKDKRGLLDYDDLIDKTLPLLSNGAARWVHYKLDLGIDHMLIDEAQDTSPKQWEIIRLLAFEFADGGARGDVKRTIFAVGDEKQSIFSFQGAQPQSFYESRRHFEKAFREARLEFAERKFEFSFRSGEIILGAVDLVYARPQAFEGLSADAVKTVHSALPDAAPGMVELWPLIAPDKKDEDKEGWDAPFDTAREESPRVRLARRIAVHIRRWTARGLAPGEVLVLVRQRGPLFEAIIRALKNEKVPVAGADRLVLTEHIAVMDLMALADCLLLPDDDLALACVLKSPLFGLDEERLFKLAWQRRISLRNALRTQDGDDTVRAIAAELDGLERDARALTPFAFYARVLGAGGGRRKILGRLSAESNDAIDEFLNVALDYERRETPSLQGFLAWLRAAKSDVKRDMELARDEVRVMTVHGAKGLEADTVILADTTTKPAGPHDPRLLTLARGELIWAGARGDDTAAITDARIAAQRAAQNEYRRLLYVAMTRAKQRLVICGTQGTTKIPDGCWYRLADDALRPVCAAEPADDGDGEVWRYRKGEAPAVPDEMQAVAKAKKVTLTDWLTRDAAKEKPMLRSITPSAAGDDEREYGAAGGAGTARLRGLLTHRLLQALPDIPSEHRAAAADRYLERAGAGLTAEERELVAEQVMIVLDDSRFYELFRPGSRAEVPIVGRVVIGGETVRVSGRIDRLAVTPEAVLISDFKTNRAPPRRIDEVPPPYRTQLALYRAVLQKIYPKRSVRAALIWTEVPDLMELSEAILDAALAQITPA